MSEGSPEGPAPVPTRSLALVCLCAAIVSLAAYLPALRGGFVFDDSAVIAENPAVHSLQQAISGFLGSYWTRTRNILPYYRPVPVLSYAVDHAIGGLNPAVYHLTNLLLHAGCAALAGLLVAGVARHLPGISRRGVVAGSVVAAALAAAHPLHSEAVAAIYCRPDLLAAFFSLAFLNLAVRGRAIASLLALALALLSKESAISLPLVAPLAYAWGPAKEAKQERRPPRPGVGVVDAAGRVSAAGTRRVLVFSVLAAAVLGGYLLVRYAALGRIVDDRAITRLDNPIAGASSPQRWLTPVAVVARYASLWLWPSTLCADRGYDTVRLVASAGDGTFIAGATILLIAAASLAVMLVRGSPLAPVLAAAALAYIPASNLLVLIPALMGERFMYLPSLLLCVLAGAVFSRLIAATSAVRRAGRSGPVLPVVFLVTAVIVILSCGARTYARTLVYRDNLTFYSDAASSCPRSAKALYNLGNALSAARRQEDAVEAYSASIRIAPWLAVAHNNLGGALLDLRRLDEAEAAYLRAIDLDPSLVKPRASLAMLLFVTGRLGPALAQARAARSMGPGPDDARYLDDLIDRIEKRLATERAAESPGER